MSSNSLSSMIQNYFSMFLNNESYTDQLAYVKGTIKPQIDAVLVGPISIYQPAMHNCAVALQGALAALIDANKTSYPTQQATASDMSIANFMKITTSNLGNDSGTTMLYILNAQKYYLYASAKVTASPDLLTDEQANDIKQNMPTAIMLLVLSMLSIIKGQPV
jgi:hypothetical protein